MHEHDRTPVELWQKSQQKQTKQPIQNGENPMGKGTLQLLQSKYI